eukprot:364662-Chlamydomonas_euryale.AAC.7
MPTASILCETDNPHYETTTRPSAHIAMHVCMQTAWTLNEVLSRPSLLAAVVQRHDNDMAAVVH